MKTKFITQYPKQYHDYLASLRETAVFMAQNPEQSAKWFGEYLRMDPAIILQVAKEDQQTFGGDPGQIDLSVKPADRAMIENRLVEAFAEKIVKVKVDSRSLLE